jgi:type I restriction enzyme S subunit
MSSPSKSLRAFASSRETQREEAKPVLVPKLRFPEFRGAAGWATEPMGDVYSFKSNNSLSRDKLNYAAGSVKNIHYGDIHTKFSNHFDVTKELVPFINESEEGIVRDESLCAEGDMIFADASEDMADIGKSIEIVRLNGERVVSGLHTILARRKGDRIALRFGGHLFKSGWVRTQIQKEAQGAKVLGISANRMRNLRLPLPPLPEQQKIAECLSSVDELIAAQARNLDALKTHKKGLMQQLFPREGETQPRLRFPEFQDKGEWSEGRLADIATVLQGYGFPERHQGQTSGDYPFYKVSDISRSLAAGKLFIEESANYINESLLKELRAKPIPEGTTIFAKIGEAIRSNKRAITTVPCLIDNNAAGVKCIKGKATDFFIYLLMEQISLIDHAGGVVPAVNKSAIEEIPIKFPEWEEQQRIADCLSSLDGLIAAETQKLEALKTHKRGLMQQLFPSPEGVEK